MQIPVGEVQCPFGNDCIYGILETYRGLDAHVNHTLYREAIFQPYLAWKAATSGYILHRGSGNFVSNCMRVGDEKRKRREITGKWQIGWSAWERFFKHIIIQWQHGERYGEVFGCIKVDRNALLLSGSVDVRRKQIPLQLSWQSVRLLTVRSQVRTLLEEYFLILLTIPSPLYGLLKFLLPSKVFLTNLLSIFHHVFIQFSIMFLFYIPFCPGSESRLRFFIQLLLTHVEPHIPHFCRVPSASQTYRYTIAQGIQKKSTSRPLLITPVCVRPLETNKKHLTAENWPPKKTQSRLRLASTAMATRMAGIF